MAKPTKDSFVLELKLFVLDWQHHILQTRFELARKLYNTTLSYALKKYQLMKESKNYRKQLRLYQETKLKLERTAQKEKIRSYKKEVDSYAKTLNDIRQSYGLTEYGLHAYIKKHQQNVKKHIDSNTSQKIASTVWKAMQTVIFQGKKAHFKKYGTLTSVEGKSNKAGIRFKDNAIHWNGVILPVIIRKNDLFVKESLALHTVKYCRIIKKVIRGRDAYYVQLVMDGIPPAKRINSTGSFRHKETPSNRIGVDIGTSTVAVVSETELFIKSLAPKVPQFEKEKKRLLRKLDRSRRSTNLNNFNPNGTIKNGVKLTWNRSNNYLKILCALKELYRKRTVYVKEQHSQIANRILTCGNEVYVETMNFKSLAKRTKETKKNKKGKFQRKKRFGKSIGSYAPAMLIEIIDKKLNYTNNQIHKVNTRTFKASQYNHVTDTCKKKKLHQRWTLIGNDLVQRDLYSAFLLMNSKSNLQHPNRELCKETFEKFIELHNQQIEQLKQNKDQLPSSMGMKRAS